MKKEGKRQEEEENITRTETHLPSSQEIKGPEGQFNAIALPWYHTSGSCKGVRSGIRYSMFSMAKKTMY